MGQTSAEGCCNIHNKGAPCYFTRESECVGKESGLARCPMPPRTLCVAVIHFGNIWISLEEEKEKRKKKGNIWISLEEATVNLIIDLNILTTSAYTLSNTLVILGVRNYSFRFWMNYSLSQFGCRVCVKQ